MLTIRKEIKKGDYLYALVPDHPNATKNGYVLMHLLVLTVEGYSCVVGTDITQRVHVTFVQGIATEHSILKIDN